MVAPLLAPIASTVGTYLASKGMDLLSGIFKGGVDKSIDAVSKTIEEKTGISIEDIADEKISEQDLGKLKQFEMDYQEMLLKHMQEMKSLEIEREKVHQEDRANARNMQIAALKQDDMLAKRFIYYYSIFVTLLTFIYIYLITFNKLDPAQTRIADTVLGFLLGVSLSAIIQFFYGSSQGSSDKSSQLSVLTQQLADVSVRKGESQ